jgi:Na+-driven multidrug efflux pump
VTLSLGAGVLFGVVLLAARTVLPEVFTDDDRVIALATTALLAVALLQPVGGVVFALDGVLIGAGDLRYLAWAMGAVAAGFLPLLLVVDTLGWLWVALAAMQVGRLVALVGRWRTTGWLVVGA